MKEFLTIQMEENSLFSQCNTKKENKIDEPGSMRCGSIQQKSIDTDFKSAIVNMFKKLMESCLKNKEKYQNDVTSNR